MTTKGRGAETQSIFFPNLLSHGSCLHRPDAYGWLKFTVQALLYEVEGSPAPTLLTGTARRDLPGRFLDWFVVGSFREGPGSARNPDVWPWGPPGGLRSPRGPGQNTSTPILFVQLVCVA
jgi:hypothetical protein